MVRPQKAAASTFLGFDKIHRFVPGSTVRSSTTRVPWETGMQFDIAGFAI